MGDMENAVKSASAAMADWVEIDDATARVIASMYHEGQASISYSFASTGAIADPTAIYQECFPVYAALPHNEKVLADMFGTYLTSRESRDAVPGWSGLWLN